MGTDDHDRTPPIPDRPPVEAAVRARLAHDDVPGAVATTLTAYGPEVFGFLAVAAGEAPARVVYARLVDELHRSLPRFAWRCALRTFVYYAARRELRRRALGPASARGRAVPTVRRRARRGVIAVFRRRLSAGDRELLVLRVDRGLGWRELAQTSLGEDATELEVEAESAELRRRFLVLRRDLARLLRRATDLQSTPRG